MYAVIISGGKQYRVSEGETLRLEKIEADLGAEVKFDKVLMVANGEQVKIGAPYLDGGAVRGTIVEHGRHKKVKIIKFRRRKHHMKHMGHRQHYTAVKIVGIDAVV